MIVRSPSGADQNDLDAGPLELPHCAGPLRMVALAIARDAKALLSPADAPWLSVSRQHARGPVRLSLWNACYVPDPDLLPTQKASARASEALRSIESNAAALIDNLASRWPVTHMPPALGFITDGVGIGFSPDDPCPSRPGWLLSQLSGETGLTIVLPFAGQSPWRSLQPARPDQSRH